MKRLVCTLAAALLLSAGGTTGSVRAQGDGSPMSGEQLREVLDTYCVACHNERLRTAGLLLDQADTHRIAAGAEVWEKAIRKLRGGLMPPAGRRRPDPGTVDRVVATLEGAIDRAAAADPDPGRRTLHRLNRTEYGNAIRDLLALEIDVASVLPPDDSSYGFDNIAEVLNVSPYMLERYLSAALRISRAAVGDASMAPTAATYSVAPDLSQDYHVDGLPFGTRGGTVIRHTFPVDGEYDLRVRLARTTWGTVRGLALVQPVDVRLDGVLVERLEAGGIGRYFGQDVRGHDLDSHLVVRVPVTAGPHEITVTFPKRSHAQRETGGIEFRPGSRPQLRKPYVASNVSYGSVSGLPQVHRVFVEGPYGVTGAGDTPSRRRIFVCYPGTAAEEAPCAEEIVGALARRAYRRPPTGAEVRELLVHYETARQAAGFEAGIQMALRALLVQPEFLFRIEEGSPGSGAGIGGHSGERGALRVAAHPVSDLELASRLSFFLWSSIPDEELLALAEAGRLREPAVLERQARRMLADPRADELVSNFAAQWLYTRNMGATYPNGALYPDYDDNLRQAMRRETELLFESILREDRSVIDLLTADYTFVNERLARHYGIEGVYGSRFRRVTLPDGDPRGGLLGQGSLLTVTSHATRTSPVVRGKWILENILGTPPPEPPPGVPPLPDAADLSRLTMRERMERHRANPACAGCHNQMDPLGLALEAFDAVGHLRTVRGSATEPIDVSGVMPDGTAFAGAGGLRDILVGRSDQFVQTLTEKLLTYALGRGVEYHDMPAVRGILRDAAATDYRFSSIVLGVVRSVPFQLRRAAEPDADARAQSGAP